MRDNNLTHGSVFKVLVTFAIPFLLANILQSLYGAVDLFVVGRYCGAESVAAVSTGTQVTQIITSLCTGLTLGSTILVGNYTGQEDRERVKKSIGTTLVIFAAFAILLTGLMLVFERPILTLLKTPAASFEQTVTYVTICSLGILFICGYNAISAILRGYGDSVRPMMFVGVACGINIVLDFLFVGPFGMGVAGTALATIMSQALSMVFAIIYLKRGDFIFDFKLKSFRVERSLAFELARIGIPISFQEMLIRISFLYLTAMMNACGVAAAAVVGVGAKFDVFAMLTGTSLANALAAISAQNMGAGKPERAKRSLWYALGIGFVVSSAFWLWAQIDPAMMIGVFTKEQSIITAGVPYFKSASYDYILVTFVFILNGYLNGRQKTLWTMLSSTFGAVVLRIPMVYIFSRMFANDLGMLGRIAPTVSGIMACYTLIYVIIEGRGRKQNR